MAPRVEDAEGAVECVRTLPRRKGGEYDGDDGDVRCELVPWVEHTSGGGVDEDATREDGVRVDKVAVAW